MRSLSPAHEAIRDYISSEQQIVSGMASAAGRMTEAFEDYIGRMTEQGQAGQANERPDKDERDERDERGASGEPAQPTPVSYTHLTLPTKA